MLKRIAYFLTSLTLLGIGGTASAQIANAENWCPTVPSGSGLTWTFESGRDSSVCTATTTQNNGMIGVYFGFFPGFNPQGKTSVLEGSLNGAPVHWYRSDRRDVNFKVGLETFVPNSANLLIWVYAQDDKSLHHLLSVTELLQFRAGASGSVAAP